MVLQARAEATRRRILDSAVDLFDELGYGETGLADVLQRANVSKGAFYYHFDSKEAVASAIIGDFRRLIQEAIWARGDQSAPMLDQIIVATFISAEMLQSDKHVRIGNQLLQALSQISSSASQVYAEWTTQFVGALSKGLAEIGVREGVDPLDTAEAAWAGVVGSHLLSSALSGEPFTRLVRAWRSVIRATLPEHLVEDYHRFVDSGAAQVQQVG